MSAKLSEWLFGIIFSVIGTIFLLAGTFLTVYAIRFSNNSIETTAEVLSTAKHTDSDGDTFYTIYITYEVNGKKLESSFDTGRYISEGKNIVVYYDINKPTKVHESRFEFVGLIFGGLGFVACIIGYGVIIHKINKNHTRKFLLKNGKKIYADFQEVITNYSYSVNGYNPYIILCHAIIDGEEYNFKSENIWKDPEYVIKNKDIKTFPVYIAPNNPKKYYISIAEINNEI